MRLLLSTFTTKIDYIFFLKKTWNINANMSGKCIFIDIKYFELLLQPSETSLFIIFGHSIHIKEDRIQKVSSNW